MGWIIAKQYLYCPKCNWQGPWDKLKTKIFDPQEEIGSAKQVCPQCENYWGFEYKLITLTPPILMIEFKCNKCEFRFEQDRKELNELLETLCPRCGTADVKITWKPEIENYDEYVKSSAERKPVEQHVSDVKPMIPRTLDDSYERKPNVTPTGS